MKASRLAAAITIASAMACSSSSSQDSAPAAAITPATKFSEIYPLIFPLETKGQCSFCHSLPPNDNSNGKLSTGMDQAAAHAALVGVMSASSMCGGKPLVVPGSPETSLFFQKITGTPPCGAHMPLGGSSLTAAQVEMIHSWIAGGAKND